jgi:hypothetical protein
MTIFELDQKRKIEHEEGKGNWHNHRCAIGLYHLFPKHSVSGDQAAVCDCKDADSSTAYVDSSGGLHWWACHSELRSAKAQLGPQMIGLTSSVV